MTELEQLLEREKIRKQLYLYCKGIDERDWDLVRSCFAEEHQHQHPPFEGTLDEFIAFASHAMKFIKTTQHSISNIIVEFAEDGLSANTEANFLAAHFLEASAEKGLSFQTGEHDTDWMVHGRYVDQWVCRDGKWLIIKRNATHEIDKFVPPLGSS